MAININLLPSELKVTTGLSQALKITRMLGVIALGGFLVFGLGLAAFFIFSTFELNDLNSTNATLKSQLDALSQTESQFVALKDRIGKVKLALAVPSATKNMTDFMPFVTPFTSSTVSELDVDPAKVSATIDFKSNTDLSDFIKTISGATIYSNVTVNSFGYTPSGGYLVNLNLSPK